VKGASVKKSRYSRSLFCKSWTELSLANGKGGPICRVKHLFDSQKCQACQPCMSLQPTSTFLSASKSCNTELSTCATKGFKSSQLYLEASQTKMGKGKPSERSANFDWLRGCHLQDVEIVPDGASGGCFCQHTPQCRCKSPFLLSKTAVAKEPAASYDISLDCNVNTVHAAMPPPATAETWRAST